MLTFFRNYFTIMGVKEDNGLVQSIVIFTYRHNENPKPKFPSVF